MKYLITTFVAILFNFISMDAVGQLVNFEETWQEFLKKEKTSNISQLIKPEKDQAANYIKYCLMYANSFFCANNLVAAEKMMSEIKMMGAELRANIAGYEARYKGLQQKIEAYHQLEPLWEQFMNDKGSIALSVLEKNKAAKTVCEKGTLSKYFYMTTYAYYCEGNLERSEDHFTNRVLKLAATSFDPSVIKGLEAEIDTMYKLWEGMTLLDEAWETFMLTTVSPGYDFDLPFIACYNIPWMKVYLLNAATNLCAHGNGMLQKIDQLIENNEHSIPDDLQQKIETLRAFVNKNNQEMAVLNKAWASFIDNQTADEQLTYKHFFECDHSLDIKAFIMDGLMAPCTQASAALDSIRARQKQYDIQLDGATSQQLELLKKTIEIEQEKMRQINAAWQDFLPDDQLSGAADFGFEYCDKIAQLKAYTIDGTINICTNGKQRLEQIEQLREKQLLELPQNLENKIDKLQFLVEKIDIEWSNLQEVWSDFLPDNNIDVDIKYEHMFPCDRAAEIKAYLMDGLSKPCALGESALKNIEKIVQKYRPVFSDSMSSKHQQLQLIVRREQENLGQLNAAWDDFVPDNKLKETPSFVFEYCDKLAQIRAYTIDGSIYFCKNARQRLVDIYQLRQTYNINIDATTKSKIDRLQAAVHKSDQQLEELIASWQLHLQLDTAIIETEDYPPALAYAEQMNLVNFYCDKIAQTKSWIIKGQLNPCADGEQYLQKAQALKEEHQLSYEEDLKCQIQRLEAKVYQCKYWALVLEARRITHEERERFGPISAKLMFSDLNSKQNNCETTVEYEPLGNIGIRYIIAPHLCSKANLAKMGDPAYYQKIADWVDREVLSKYCEVSMRCKEDFFIYLEGHTDGYRFNGRDYPHAINIPEGTTFTHYFAGDTTQKVTRNIGSSLKNNMELGVARAWTVRKQLQFMGVPIRIGAYEHPEEEKGGAFRRIDIELNMTNLLLDFYEKTLARLLLESGIGKRPKKTC